MECEYTEECPARDRSEHGQCGEPGECCRSVGNMDNTQHKLYDSSSYTPAAMYNYI